jgi:pyruvate dehydrogenase E2 component (dihydrolipoamide acetyltransferase)
VQGKITRCRAVRIVPDVEATQPQTAKGEVLATEPTRIEQAFARRVAESAATIPVAHVDVRAAAADEHAVLAAFARALAADPRANGAWRDGRFERYGRVNVATVVATGDGLLAPTLFDADTKSAAELAEEAADLAAAAREGRLTSPQLSGATATMWTVPGVDRATAPVAPGQAVALALALPVEGQATLTLAFDQRVVTVPQAATLLARLADLLTQET